MSNVKFFASSTFWGGLLYIIAVFAIIFTIALITQPEESKIINRFVVTEVGDFNGDAQLIIVKASKCEVAFWEKSGKFEVGDTLHFIKIE